jgi:hypothetical protein
MSLMVIAAVLSAMRNHSKSTADAAPIEIEGA